VDYEKAVLTVISNKTTQLSTNNLSYQIIEHKEDHKIFIYIMMEIKLILAVSSEQPHACNDDCNNGSAKQIQTTNGHQTGKLYFLLCNLDNFNIFLLKTNKIIYL